MSHQPGTHKVKSKYFTHDWTNWANTEIDIHERVTVRRQFVIQACNTGVKLMSEIEASRVFLHCIAQRPMHMMVYSCLFLENVNSLIIEKNIKVVLVSLSSLCGSWYSTYIILLNVLVFILWSMEGYFIIYGCFYVMQTRNVLCKCVHWCINWTLLVVTQIEYYYYGIMCCPSER